MDAKASGEEGAFREMRRSECDLAELAPAFDKGSEQSTVFLSVVSELFCGLLNAPRDEDRPRLVIEDHDASPTMPLAEQAYLHRVSHGDVTGQLLRAGFRATDMILMDSTYDDRRFNVFRPGVRGRTDRFIAVFEKPADGKQLR